MSILNMEDEYFDDWKWKWLKMKMMILGRLGLRAQAEQVQNNDVFVFKMMDFAFKMMIFAFKMMIFVLARDCSSARAWTRRVVENTDRGVIVKSVIFTRETHRVLVGGAFWSEFG